MQSAVAIQTLGFMPPTLSGVHSPRSQASSALAHQSHNALPSLVLSKDASAFVSLAETHLS